MILLNGFIYLTFLILVGTALRMIFMQFFNVKESLKVDLDFISHGFFQGVIFIILLFNLLQYFPLSNQTLQILLASLACAAASWLVYSFRKFKPDIHWFGKETLILLILIIFSSALIYSFSIQLPNIAWDSWAVWEGRANQWLSHGLYVKIENWDNWINNPESIYNQSANYPDGLSLLFFIPKLFTNDALKVLQILYLFAFALTVLIIVNRLKLVGASYFLRVFLVVVIYTTPLLNSHLIIIGYADIWVGMILTLAMIAYLDYFEFKTKGALITLLAYLAMLPLFKLEGLVWLILFIIAHLLVQFRQHKKISLWLNGLIGVFLAWIFIIGIHLTTPMGQLILSDQQITIFGLIDTKIHFNNVTDLLMTSLFWQNNFSLIWVGLPFLMISFLTQKYDLPYRVTQVFFSLSLLSFLFLFYFTEASQWAEDFTAINRIVLQLTPCYLLLLFNMLAELQTRKKDRHQLGKA